MKLKLPSGQRLLMIYSGVLTLAFAGTVLMGATMSTRRATFDQITVHRINVVEPDGTLRMVISDKADFPGAIFHGKDTSTRAPRRACCSSMTRAPRTADWSMAGARTRTARHPTMDT